MVSFSRRREPNCILLNQCQRLDIVRSDDGGLTTDLQAEIFRLGMDVRDTALFWAANESLSILAGDVRGVGGQRSCLD